MRDITFKTSKDKAEKYNKTTVGGGGYVKTSFEDYSKYVASQNNAPSQSVAAEGTVIADAPKGGAADKTSPAGNKTAAGSVQIPGEVVAARDYVTGKGYSGVVDWDGDNVVIGGFAVKPSFVKDGMAYVPKAVADNAVKRLEEENGITTGADIEKKVRKKYGSAIEEALNALIGRDGFSYDPDTDPVFAAYRSMYEREANDAYRRVLNDNNVSVTGASGAVLGEAISARDKSLAKITDAIPGLAKDAFERYKYEGERLSDNLDALTGLAEAYYNRLYNSSSDSYNAVIKAGAAERKEKQQQSNNEYKNAQLEINREQNRLKNERNAVNDAYKNALNAIEISKKGIELDYYPQILENEIVSNKLRNSSTALNNAFNRGFFIAEDEAALPWLADYRTDSGYSINPQLTQAAYEYQKAYNKKRADINAIMGW